MSNLNKTNQNLVFAINANADIPAKKGDYLICERVVFPPNQYDLETGEFLQKLDERVFWFYPLEVIETSEGGKVTAIDGPIKTNGLWFDKYVAPNIHEMIRKEFLPGGSLSLQATQERAEIQWELHKAHIKQLRKEAKELQDRFDGETVLSKQEEALLADAKDLLAKDGEWKWFPAVMKLRKAARSLEERRQNEGQTLWAYAQELPVEQKVDRRFKEGTKFSFEAEVQNRRQRKTKPSKRNGRRKNEWAKGYA